MSSERKLFFFQAVGIIAAAALAGLAANFVSGIPLAGGLEEVRQVHQGQDLPESPGIHYLDTGAAGFFYRSGRGVIVDARPPAEYARGHLPAAVSCFVYDLDDYLPGLLAAAGFETPLMLYCNGEDCEDSRFLAEALREVGYRLIYVCLGGYDGWLEAGLPVEAGAGPEKAPGEHPAATAAVDFTALVPESAWLGIDLLILVYGLAVSFLLVRGRKESPLAAAGLKLVGVLFVAASLHKIASPLEFARVIHNYRILPGVLVNPAAVIMPWVELSCGVLLVLGRMRHVSASLLAGMIGIFILAVGFNLARGLDFDCGCFGAGHTPPWQILLRDAGLLLCCLPGLQGMVGKARKA
ncbi:MAG: hypothetical protein JXQ83_12955 [Candidatus Glassbacteria bacterium]|nr:hypothetical protein [Candidatus Glassbacteria bacterium]